MKLPPGNIVLAHDAFVSDVLKSILLFLLIDLFMPLGFLSLLLL
jgi:hypothetical protein